MLFIVEQYLLIYLPFSSAGTDYTSGSVSVVIPAGTTKVTVPVATLNDNFKEDDEYLKATLTIPTGALGDVDIGSSNMAFVTISDKTRMWEITSLIPACFTGSLLICTDRIILRYACTAYIPVRFNLADYSVKEGVDSNAVITLEALEDHPDFAFNVTVLTQSGTAIRELLQSLVLCVLHQSVHARYNSRTEGIALH